VGEDEVKRKLKLILQASARMDVASLMDHGLNITKSAMDVRKPSNYTDYGWVVHLEENNHPPKVATPPLRPSDNYQLQRPQNCKSLQPINLIDLQ